MASIATVDQSAGISVGDVFARSVNVIKTNPAATLGISFLFMGLPQLLLQRFDLSAGIIQEFRDGLYLAAGLVGLALVFLWLIAGGALVQATVAHDEGRKADVSEMLQIGIRRTLPLFAVYVLFLLGVWIGAIFLFVPGVILGVMWSASLPAVVAERTGVFGAFSRSRVLTKGARWQVFGILLLAFVIYFIASIAIGVVSVAGTGTLAALANGTTVPPESLFAQLLQAAVTTVTAAWFTIVGASLFVELRNWKDGPDVERLTEIFA
jgi:hypothetical protein